MTREWPRILAGGSCIAVLLAIVLLKLQVSTDITAFLPGGEAGRDTALAHAIATG
jgi:hypothetical protein